MNDIPRPRPTTRESLADLGPAAGLLLLHLTLLPGYGVFRDELYYMACGRHPSWGYVDHPPFVGWVAWLVSQVAGESHLALRALTAVAAAAMVFVTGRIAKELGGSPFSRLLAGLAAALLPVSLALGSVYSMNTFDLLYWALLYLLLVRILAGGDPRLWLAFGALAGLGLLNKISVLFLGFGLVVGLLVTRRWDVFRSRWIWLGGLLAAALFFPHLVWQHVHGWPTLEFMENARRDKMVEFSLAQFLGQALLHTAIAPWLWILGAGWLLVSQAASRVRPLGALFVVVIAVLVATGGKPYYLAAAYSAPLAAGAVALEAFTSQRARWARPVALALVLLLGALLCPLARPVLPVDTYVRYASALGIAAAPEERHAVGRLPQFYADMHGWHEMAEAVAQVFNTLPDEERAQACIFGQNYGEAGAMQYFAPSLSLPLALSAHNNYWLWGPGPCTGEVMIVIGDSRERLEKLFETVEHATTFQCQNCMPYESNQGIWIARTLRQPIDSLWPTLKHFQ